VVHIWGPLLFFVINTQITEMHVSCLLHFALDVPSIMHISYFFLSSMGQLLKSYTSV
jgi:hypothetical protein